MTDDEIRASMVMPARTLETELLRAEKILGRLISGDGGVKDPHDDTVKALELVRLRLATFRQESASHMEADMDAER
jgi:hypothetical protein